MNVAKSLNRVNKNIVQNGDDTWAVKVLVDGKSVAFTVEPLSASICDYKGYKIRGADGYTVCLRAWPRTLKDCAETLVRLARESN